MTMESGREQELQVESVLTWLDGGCSSWGVPAQDILGIPT
jgi:hypothetical protein